MSELVLLTDEQRLIAETARDFVDNEVVPQARDSDRAEKFDIDLARRLGEMGYLGAPVAEEYGGRALDFIGYGLIVEEVGRGDSAMRTVVSVQTSLVCGSIERWGNEEQKQRWLPKLTAGESFGCFGLTEPDTGSDAANLRTRAEKIDGGWRITGQKMWISLGNVADVALIFAQTDPDKKHKGLACFLVPTESDGFSTQEIHGKLGLRASDTASIALDEVEVGDDALMGEVGDGFKVAMSALDSGRYSVAAGCVGICEGCVRGLGGLLEGAPAVRRADGELPARPGDDRRHDRPPRRGPDARPPRGDAQGRGQAVDGRDLGGEAVRDRVGGGVREPRDPGPRRVRIRRRLPGRALPARRPGDDALRGDIADPEADHRARRDRDQRDDPAQLLALAALVETSVDGRVALCRLNRPEARNALSPALMEELADAVARFDSDPEVRCIVIAGSDEAFAAGADIGALAEREFHEAVFHPASGFWRRLAECRTPLIAAVSGWALGGGCELALICDMIVASETAEFGQPEITLGIIPGGGGTQRLARAVGKQRAMDLVLTGRRFDAAEAQRMGIVNSVAGKGDWLASALELAQRVAKRPPIAARLAKQAVLVADETSLGAGLEQERRLYELAMATEDRVEGMQAFLEKRRPEFKGR